MIETVAILHNWLLWKLALVSGDHGPIGKKQSQKIYCADIKSTHPFWLKGNYRLRCVIVLKLIMNGKSYYFISCSKYMYIQVWLEVFHY